MAILVCGTPSICILGIQHASKTDFLAKEVYFLSKIQENLTSVEDHEKHALFK